MMRQTATRARAAWVVLALALLPAGAAAQRVADPFGLKVNNPWPGNLVGGYWPASVTVENLRDPVDAVVMLLPHSNFGGALSSVERPVRLGRGETARVVLPVPVHDWGRYQVQVYVDGYQMIRHPPYIDAPYSSRYGRHSGTTIIAVSQAAPDLRQVEAAIASISGGSASVVHTTPDHLPDLWQPYSSSGVVVVDIDALSRMSPAQRSALGAWVFAGGTCLIHPVRSDADSRKVIDGLGLAGEHRELQSLGLDDATGLIRAQVGLGRVLRHRDEVFPMSRRWWHGVVTDRDNAPICAGTSGKERSTGLEIPGVGEPPVSAFLIISIFFIVLIGPANWYVVLKRLKKPPLFLVTTPVLALATSVIMLSYSFISEGFGTHVASRTVAVLDPDSHRGVTWSRHSIYAGVAPYGGLKFSASTLVMPESVPPGRRSVAWADGLRMKGGWLPARTKCSYVTCTQYPARWRVRAAKTAAGWQITNGLPVGMTYVVINTADGMVVGENIPAGGTSTGLPMSDTASLRRLGPFSSDMRRFGIRRTPADFLSSGSAEWAHAGGYLPYMATLEKPLGAELGIENYTEEDGRHAVIGLAEGSR
jgi:hypothetical protein